MEILVTQHRRRFPLFFWIFFQQSALDLVWKDPVHWNHNLFLKFTELIQSDWVHKASTVKDAQIRMARDGAGDCLCELFLKADKRRSGMWFTCVNYSDM